jgi:TonB family protein
MNTAASPTFRPPPHELRAMNRMLVWSIALHVGAVAALILVPRDWLSEPPSKPLTITLGGTPGPRSTGTTSIGGRTVEQVAPPPKRAEPVRPTPPAPPAPIAKPSAPSTRPADVQKPPTVAARPPVTGPQVVQGNTAVDTGARGQGQGLTFGGGGTGGETDLSSFCCPEYLQLLTSKVYETWRKDQPERGTAEVRFTIARNGRVSNVEIAKTSGISVLDRISRNAITDLPPLPLPDRYSGEVLTIRMVFPYEGR